MLKKVLCAGLVAMMLAGSGTVLAADYVGNSNSMKFHYASCRAAKKIRAENRVEFEDRDAAVDAGYQPCGICQP